MSNGKFDFSTYKLFEPQYQPERLIIVDADSIESPETVTLRYEEEAAARANGGGRRGESPTGLLPMATYAKPQLPQMHTFDSGRTYPDYPYPPHQFHSSSTENGAAQMNQMAFAANNAPASYISHAGPSLISCLPSSGAAGTKVMVKISALYDSLEVTSHFFLSFGNHRSPAHATRDTSDGPDYCYVVSAEAPHFHLTRCDNASVPLSLCIDSTDGHPMATVDLGTFTFDHNISIAGSPHDERVTHRKGTKSPDGRQEHLKHEHNTMHHNPTNAFGYPQPEQAGVVGGYATDLVQNTMVAPYQQRMSYMGGDYSRAPPPLKTTPSWGPYGTSLDSRSPVISHTTARHSLTALPNPGSTAPQLVRTSTLQSSGSSSSAYAYSGHGYPNKAALHIDGDLNSMVRSWSNEEWNNQRRIVLFTKRQEGSKLTANFRPVTVSERPPNSICVSCIYWKERDEWFVTSVDTISLLEQLVAAPARFTVEEKNRIRRNLEGFRPLTVSKAKADSEEFFKLIMAFPNPKPRNIEKDVKVFPWKVLTTALKKIIGKYSASPSSTLPPSALLTPISNASPGLYQTSHTPSISDNSYSHHDTHPAMPSPRSLSGGGASAGWGGYRGPVSPSLKTLSPPPPIPARIPGLSPHGIVSDPRQQQQQTPAYGLPPNGMTTRWDGYGDPGSGAPATYTGHQPHHGQVYSGGHYGDRGHRE